MKASLHSFHQVLHHTGRWFVRLVAGALLLAIGLAGLGYAGARYYFWPRLDGIAREQIARVEQSIGAKIDWRAMTTDWEGLRPSFDVHDLTIGTGESAIRVGRLAAVLSLQSLLLARPTLQDLRIDRPVLPLLRFQGTWRIAALTPSEGDAVRRGGPSADDVAGWLAAVPELRIGAGQVIVVDGEGMRSDRRFERIDAVLKSQGRLHELRMDVGDAPGLAGTLNLQAELLRPRGDAAQDWTRWEANVRLKGRQVDVAALLGDFGSRLTAPGGPLAARLNGISGRIDPDLAIELKQGRAIQGRLALQSGDLRLPVAAGREGLGPSSPVPPPLSLSQLALDVRWRLQADGRWHVDLPTFAAAGPSGLRLRAAERGTEAVYDPSTGRLQRVALRLVQAELAETLALARPFAPVLDRLSLAGLARDVAIDWSDDGSWHLRSALDGATVRIAPTEADLRNPHGFRASGLRQVSGTIDATQAGGQLQLAAAAPVNATGVSPAASASASAPAPHPAAGPQQAAAPAPPASAVLTLGGLLAEAEVPLSEFDAALRWKVRPAGASGAGLPVDLTVERLRIANNDLALRLAGHYVGAERGPGSADLTATLDRVVARRVWRYLPQQMPAPVRQWVKLAFEAGSLEQGQLVLKGPLQDFPFRPSDRRTADPPGQFRFAGQLRDVLLKFAPEWPAIHRVAGELVIERAGLRFTEEHAEIGATQLTGVQAAIEDFAHPELVVTGEARGDAGDLVRFVNASPLAAAIGTMTRPMRASGPARLNLGLRIPFAPEVPAKVDGRLALTDVSLQFEAGQPEFTGVGGELQFERGSLSFDGLRARLFGSPIEIAGEASGGEARVRAAGRLSADSLRALADNPLTRQLAGAADFKASFDFSRGGLVVGLDSDLVGLSSQLPAPLAKPADAHWPLRIASRPVPPGRAELAPAGDPDGRWLLAAGPSAAGSRSDAPAGLPARIGEPEPARDAPRATPGAPGTLVERIEAELNGELRLAAERVRSDLRKPLQVARVAVAMNRTPVLPGSGVAIQYTGARLDVDAWRKVFEAPSADRDKAVRSRGEAERGESSRADPIGAETARSETAGGEAGGGGMFVDGFSALPNQVSIVADELRIADRLLNRVEFDASRLGERWIARVRAQQLSGTFNWDESALANREGRLVARFGRLEIPRSQQEAVASLIAQEGPTSLPALDVTADALVLGGFDLGRLELLATNDARGPVRAAAPAAAGRGSPGGAVPARHWRLERLRLVSPAAEFNATGSWRQATELDYQLKIHDAGKLLERFDLKGVVKGGSGDSTGQLRWKGSPLGFDLPSLAGELSLALKDGQFVKVEPGAAKLIGVLNLQALPKLLTLDFKDLFAEGFVFGELRGSVAIDRGIARTDSLAMRGLQAVVEMKGQADLRNSTQDLRVVVLPELNGGLASLAYAAIINPAIGLGAFLAQSILSPSLSKALAYEIDISGSWADPKVTQRKRERLGPPVERP